MIKLFGVSNGEQGLGVGEIVELVGYRIDHDMVIGTTLEQQEVELFSVFESSDLNVLY